VDAQAGFLLGATAAVGFALAVLLPPLRRARGTALILALGLPAFAFGLYALYGDPGALNAERRELDEQWLREGLPAPGEASARLYAELQHRLQKQPRDSRALVIKARLDLRDERVALAAEGFAAALAGRSKVANDPGVWVEFAEARGLAQGGRLAGEPLQLVLRALSLDAQHPGALDLAGSAAWEAGDFAGAAAYWQRLLEQLTPGSQRHAELAAAIGRARQRVTRP